MYWSHCWQCSGGDCIPVYLNSQNIAKYVYTQAEALMGVLVSGSRDV